MCAWFANKPAGTDSLKVSDDMIRANWAEVELRRLDNLIKNGSFASYSAGATSVPDGWALEGTPTIAYDTVDTGYGTKAIKLTATGAANEGVKITLTGLKVSTKYQVFARVKVTSGDTATLVTTGATTNIDEDSTSTSWEDITGEVVTDASATNVVVKLVASADGDIVWFCGVTCVEGDIPPANYIQRIVDEHLKAIDYQDTTPTNYDFGLLRMECGTATISISSDVNGSVNVTFGTAFTKVLAVISNVQDDVANCGDYNITITAKSTTGITIYAESISASSRTISFDVDWIAIGVG